MEGPNERGRQCSAFRFEVWKDRERGKERGTAHGLFSRRKGGKKKQPGVSPNGS